HEDVAIHDGQLLDLVRNHGHFGYGPELVRVLVEVQDSPREQELSAVIRFYGPILLANDRVRSRRLVDDALVLAAVNLHDTTDLELVVIVRRANEIVRSARR